MELHHHPRVENHEPHLAQEACSPRGDLNKRLTWILLISALAMVAEIVGGIMAQSLALLSDGFHMFTHVGSLLISSLGLAVATRKTSEDKTFGYWRAEILTALFNAVTLLPIVGFIFYEAFRRFRHPLEVQAWPTLIVGGVGLLVNLVGAALLHRHHGGDLNARSAFFHLMGDTLSSVGVVVAALLIAVTGWTWLDPAASLLIAALILLWSAGLIRDCLSILLEAAPRGLNLQDVRATILGIRPVRDIHDLHIWQITSGMTVLTCHVVMDDAALSSTGAVLREIQGVLDHRFKISHSSIQIECAPPADR